MSLMIVTPACSSCRRRAMVAAVALSLTGDAIRHERSVVMWRNSGGVIGRAVTFQSQSDGFYKFTHGIDKLVCPILHDEVTAVFDNDMH